MERRTLIGVAIIGGGLLWYMNSQSPTSTLPTTTTTASTITNTDGSTTTTNTDGTTTTTATDGTVTTTDADGTVIDTPETTTETTEGSDDSSAVDPTDCSKYRKAHHRDPKVWMSSTKTKTWPGAWYPSGARMKNFETDKEQYFINDVVNWDLDIGVRNHSNTNCDKGLLDVTNTCWFAPYSNWSAGGNDGNHLYCKMTWTSPENETYLKEGGAITRHTTWSNLIGDFRIPDKTSSIGVWSLTIEYGWNEDGDSRSGMATWSGNVFRVVPEVCGQETSAAENFASDFTRPIYAPAISHQSFMQF